MFEIGELNYLKDLWDPAEANALAEDQLALLRYRSNLLGKDLRITNFGGGNTSSKFELTDPFTGVPVRVLAVKGSGGDLGSIRESGFALLYLDRLEHLKEIYRGEAHEDDMVRFYPLSAFGENRVAASIDTPLHTFLPFAHVDHLHPDWAIALAASANGKRKLEEFNRKFGRNIIWIPWQRPGFELAMLLHAATKQNPRADGILLASHGLFTWGATQRECYSNSLRTIDQMGAFVQEHEPKAAVRFGGVKYAPLVERSGVAAQILPALRGELSRARHVAAHYCDNEDALAFAGSKWCKELAEHGTSCPDHFLRTKICPMYVDWDPASSNLQALRARIQEGIREYRADYKQYYESLATADSPKLRDPNPSVVIIPGLGLFGFGRSKKEARISTEFFINAIHVMAGATALDDGSVDGALPQARRAEQSAEFKQFHNYVALPRSEAFRIEYWALEEAKLQRMPPEPELARNIVVVIGAASGIGKETALLLARKGAHVILADLDRSGTEETASAVSKISGEDSVGHTGVDLSSTESISGALRFAILHFGGIDAIVNTAAIYPVPSEGDRLTAKEWAATFQVNVVGNYELCRAAESVFREQGLPASIVLTSSANAVVPKAGSEAYDTSKAALSHLVRELAIALAPDIRVNGIAPATVVAGSAMFPRERVMRSLEKYQIEFSPVETTEALRGKLADFYARRTLTKRPILPEDCARAIVWLLSDDSAKTTGHVIPVDGGLPEAFLR
ncbi:MAG TPA: bifunctional rhamnulose-1-phosphate aldolase/short-chain dehydrogenase [Candidatus Limnocylindrales bacterium]|nr:bifunctional rhamnulose-1-phosphate aldolase/short-chain dehydrogenase [Candidatus Limnocylindrales bacterium]